MRLLLLHQSLSLIPSLSFPYVRASIVPTPAAASLLSTPAGKSSEIGVLQFVPMSRNEKPVYIAEPDFTGQCGPTMEIKAALRLSWDRSVDSECRVLEWVVGRGPSVSSLSALRLHADRPAPLVL